MLLLRIQFPEPCPAGSAFGGVEALPFVLLECPETPGLPVPVSTRFPLQPPLASYHDSVRTKRYPFDDKEERSKTRPGSARGCRYRSSEGQKECFPVSQGTGPVRIPGFCKSA